MTSGTIRLRAEERWQGASLSTRRLSRTMAAIALVSLGGHVAILAGAAFDTKPAPPPTQEIAVEIVQDVPKPAEKPPAKAVEMPKPFEIDKGKTETAKLEAKEPAKPEAAKPAPPKPAPKPEAAKPEAAKPEPPKPEPPKQVAKVEPPKPAPVKAEPPAPKAPPPKADEEAAKDKQVADLQQQLEALKAEQAQLQSERDAETAAAQQQAAPMRDTGMGPLPDSFQAVALPAAADGQGEATSYQEIVFSALAKAKGIGNTQGIPGTAAVHFTIDATGKLVDVVLVHKSGIDTLDAEALDIVHRASPFPVPPQGAQRGFDANFTFKTQAAAR